MDGSNLGEEKFKLKNSVVTRKLAKSIKITTCREVFIDTAYKLNIANNISYDIVYSKEINQNLLRLEAVMYVRETDNQYVSLEHNGKSINIGISNIEEDNDISEKSKVRVILPFREFDEISLDIKDGCVKVIDNPLLAHELKIEANKGVLYLKANADKIYGKSNSATIHCELQEDGKIPEDICIKSKDASINIVGSAKKINLFSEDGYIFGKFHAKSDMKVKVETVLGDVELDLIDFKTNKLCQMNRDWMPKMIEYIDPREDLKYTVSGIVMSLREDADIFLSPPIFETIEE